MLLQKEALWKSLLFTATTVLKISLVRRKKSFHHVAQKQIILKSVIGNPLRNLSFSLINTENHLTEQVSQFHSPLQSLKPNSQSPLRKYIAVKFSLASFISRFHAFQPVFLLLHPFHVKYWILCVLIWCFTSFLSKEVKHQYISHCKYISSFHLTRSNIPVNMNPLLSNSSVGGANALLPGLQN